MLCLCSLFVVVVVVVVVAATSSDVDDGVRAEPQICDISISRKTTRPLSRPGR